MFKNKSYNIFTINLIASFIFLLIVYSCQHKQIQQQAITPLNISTKIADTMKNEKNTTQENSKKTDTNSLKEKLSPEQYYVCIEKGTERPFTGKYYNHHETGTYLCAVCKKPLFDSETKYESGSGWPSFYQPFSDTAIKENLDKSHGMVRTEIVCKHCGSHLGHVFPDGPKPTGLRYCVNSLSLDFIDKKIDSTQQK